MLPRLDIQVWDMLNDDNDDDDDDDDDDGDTSLSPSSPPTLFYFPKNFLVLAATYLGKS
jgi:hypothetical protein